LADIVNLAYAERCEASVEAERQLVRLAMELQQRCGPRLDLLSIRAEHVDSLPEQRSLLLEVYQRATATGDAAYRAWAAHALASHHVEAAFNPAEAERWLATAQELVAASEDEDAADDLDRLSRTLLRRRSRGLVPRRKCGRRTRAGTRRSVRPL